MVLFQATQLPPKICLCTLPLLFLSIAMKNEDVPKISTTEVQGSGIPFSTAIFTETEVVLQTLQHWRVKHRQHMGTDYIIWFSNLLFGCAGQLLPQDSSSALQQHHAADSASWTAPQLCKAQQHYSVRICTLAEADVAISTLQKAQPCCPSPPDMHVKTCSPHTMCQNTTCKGDSPVSMAMTVLDD